MFFAHSLVEESEEKWHKLHDHLQTTGDLAAYFGSEFGVANAARAAGLLHDLGKYSNKFQARLHGSNESVDHSTAGAQEILSHTSGHHLDIYAARLIAYAIAGHHAGLADTSRLLERLKEQIEPLAPIWQKEITLSDEALWPNIKNLCKDKLAFQLSFLGRMLFSCLVDADYKDTERFYTQHEQRTVDRTWPDLRAEVAHLINSFDAYMAKKKSGQTEVNSLRHNILTHIRSHATDTPGLFTLTVPTGGGKTLASLGFALDHAKHHNLRRIIYAIPFTSIIDQTASVFRDLLGDAYILEHHASIDQDKFTGQEQQRSKLKLAMEDWAAPVVVTTNVQLFESLFAHRPSHCRKLHNLANSIIILDEAQTLPLPLLRPCLRALNELALNYNCTIILCTATQPALDQKDLTQDGLPLEGRELAPPSQELAQKLRRVTIQREGELDNVELVEALQKNEQALMIVNSRRHSLVLYQQAKQNGLDGLYHLTTRQHAQHRREILAEIRSNLSQKKPCRVIATSLVEAGVDLDFPRVWRAEAGLDQIIQAAGRCNREGRNAVLDSIVTVFRPREAKPPAEIAQLAAAYLRTAQQHDDLLSPEAIQTYFKELFWSKGHELLDAKNILDCFKMSGQTLAFDYQTAAQRFRMIDSGLVPVIINETLEVKSILDKLNNEKTSIGMAARELQSYIVQIPPRDRDKLLANGQIRYHKSDLWGDQFAVLESSDLYTKEAGLIWENAGVLTDSIF